MNSLSSQKNIIIDKKEYLSFISEEVIYVTRLVAVLGIAMFLLFVFVDKFAFAEPPLEILYVRLAIVVVLVLTIVTTLSGNFSEKYACYILPVPYLTASIGVNYITYLAGPNDYASQIYFVGLMLIIMMLFAWSFLKTIQTFLICGFIIGSYIIAVYSNNTDFFANELAINLIFLASSALIGISSQFIRNRHLQANFIMQKRLKEALEIKKKESESYEYKANHDVLTGLPNRRYITALLEESLQIAKKKNKILAVLFFDLNGFKQVNDIYGHAVGDEVLVIVAKRLELAIRKGDHISRLGGDEYLVGLMMSKDQASEITNMAEKFTAIISEPMRIDGNLIKVGASVGIAAYPMHGNNINVLIDIADKKMYNIKKGINKASDDSEKDEQSADAGVIFPSNSKKLAEVSR